MFGRVLKCEDGPCSSFLVRITCSTLMRAISSFSVGAGSKTAQTKRHVEDTGERALKRERGGRMGRGRRRACAHVNPLRGRSRACRTGVRAVACGAGCGVCALRTIFQQRADLLGLRGSVLGEC